VHISVALNAILASGLVIILIIADYARKYNTDTFQRKAFFRVLLSAMIAMLTDFCFYALTGYSGRTIYYILYIDLLIYYTFQIASFCYLFIFIDYLSFKDPARIKNITKIAWAVFIIHGIILLFNLPLGFYFYITQDNAFARGDKYFIRLILSYFPVLMVIFDIFLFNKNLKKTQVYLSFFFILFTVLGSTVDIIFNTTSLIWSCYIPGLLYAYFFIVRTDSKIDSLTGIGNRYSFNEFIHQVSGQNAKQPYSVVMIDMDHFKEINDTLGHLEGDNALRDMAAIIKGCIRYSDFAARYGGDEFVLATKKESDIARIMERIQQAIDNQNEKNIRPYKIQISYGYDVFTPNGDRPIEAFLSHIDSLMYKHKAAKRRNTDRENT
jgi:diguanylate cyclase (GGDEF)-like protein